MSLTKNLVYSNKHIQSGVYCFAGTRIPVHQIMNYISLGWSLNDIKNSFPTINTDHVGIVLQEMTEQFFSNVRIKKN